ncbi:MAG TPA: NUDIX domain-containing protein [Gaiellaceae bacterium]|jgi:ADP-ribose pyrophosphatase YjhB (NUDIX family)|nr:NUDIX domain-containing protein [Gaiellaceae bacterium]
MGISDYVRTLREKVGTDLLFMPSVASLVEDGDGRILLVRHVEGRWMLPGGAVDPGERPAEAARRECLEEAGVEIEPIRILGVYGGPEYRVTYANGDEAMWIVTIFEARLVAGEPAPSDDETIDVGWFTREEIDALPQSDAMRATLRDVFSGESFTAP